MSECIGVQEARLPHELAAVVGPEQLRSNVVSNYPEMQLSLTKADVAQIDRIRQILLTLPLVHSTNSHPYQFEKVGIKPLSQLPAGTEGRAMRLDESLGLTDYVYAKWGKVPELSFYGNNHLLLDPRLLLSPDTIVTPLDLVCAANASMVQQWSDLRESEIEKIENNYLKTMVTGADWLEITARKVWQIVSNDPNAVVALGEGAVGGEIKHRGVVKPASIIRAINSAKSRHDYWAQQLGAGFLACSPAEESGLPVIGRLDDRLGEFEPDLVERARGVWRAALDLTA